MARQRRLYGDSAEAGRWSWRLPGTGCGSPIRWTARLRKAEWGPARRPDPLAFPLRRAFPSPRTPPPEVPTLSTTGHGA
jgi:hypothetical protein